MADTSSPSCYITLSRRTLLWRMLSALPWRPEMSPSGGSYCAPGPADRQAEEAPPLDPIDVAGSADRRVLSTMTTTLKFSATIDALNWLRDDTSILDTTRPFPTEGRGGDTATRFLVQPGKQQTSSKVTSLARRCATRAPIRRGIEMSRSISSWKKTPPFGPTRIRVYA